MLMARLALLALLAGIGFASAADLNSPLHNDERWKQAQRDLAQGKAVEAKAEFDELLKRYPDEADLHLFQGMSLLRLRDPDEAILAAKRAIELNPNHVDARTFLAWIELEVRGNVEAAIKQYQKTIELHPELAEAYVNLAVAQKRRGELVQAVDSLNKALERKPNLATALNNRGWIYTEQEKWAEARSDFEQALMIDPQDQGALQGLARVLEKERDYAGAQRILARLNSRSPNFVYWLDWGRIGLIRFWWVLLSIAIVVAVRVWFKKARMEANG
jgi:tetratricopeptide (TPR) repeat protein